MNIIETLTAQVKALREGESVSRSIRVPLDRQAAKALKKGVAKLRNSMNQIAVRAKETTERSYRIESGQFVTHDGSAVIGVVTLSCATDEGEDDI